MSGFFHISAKDHSAMLLLSALSRAFDEGSFISLQEVAQQMHVSQGYLEEIAAQLKKANLIVSKQGSAGGYRLARAPQDITLEHVMIALEGPVALVDCQVADAACPVAKKCSSKNIWSVLQKSIQQTLRETTLAQTL